jgi:hypothetical protein
MSLVNLSNGKCSRICGVLDGGITGTMFSVNGKDEKKFEAKGTTIFKSIDKKCFLKPEFRK